MTDIIKDFREIMLTDSSDTLAIRARQFAAKYQNMELNEYDNLIEEMLSFISNDSYCINNKKVYLNTFFMIAAEEAKLEILDLMSNHIMGKEENV